MLRAVPVHALTHAEQKTLHGWNEMNPRFDGMSRESHRSYALVAQNASRLQTNKRSFHQTQTVELRPNPLKPSSKHIRYASPLNLTIATTESAPNTYHRSLIDLYKSCDSTLKCIASHREQLITHLKQKGVSELMQSIST